MLIVLYETIACQVQIIDFCVEAGIGLKNTVHRVKRQEINLTLDTIRAVHAERREQIVRRLDEFSAVWNSGSNDLLWEEMVYCFYTGGCSAKMGLKAVSASRHLLRSGTREEITQSLLGVHRYPNARSRYVVESRQILHDHVGFDIRKVLTVHEDFYARRDWLVKEIKGLGYKEASHFLRNVGFRGYAILDKHVLRCMAELGLIEDPKPPSTRSRYHSVEVLLKELAISCDVDFDELDLVLWSIKTGEILK